jgi:phage portal protein BeeE
MGLLDFLLPTDERAALTRVRERREQREKFTAQASIGDPTFASWLMQSDDSQEAVTPYTVLGLSAVLRAVSIIATTIAGLPLKTYERGEDGERVQIASEFDDPYPGVDGMTPFAWVETILMHLLIWRKAFLWHEARADGTQGFAYRPIIPDAITVSANGQADLHLQEKPAPPSPRRRRRSRSPTSPARPSTAPPAIPSSTRRGRSSRPPSRAIRRRSGS